MLITRTRLFLVAFLNNPVGGLKKAAPAVGSNRPKIGSGAALKMAVLGGSATLAVWYHYHGSHKLYSRPNNCQF